jgi:hypothetical protein
MKIFNKTIRRENKHFLASSPPAAPSAAPPSVVVGFSSDIVCIEIERKYNNDPILNISNLKKKTAISQSNNY